MKKIFPYFLLFLVNLIYGLNFSIAKLVLPNYIKPLGLVTLRTGFAMIFFYIISYFSKSCNEKIEKKDYIRLFGLAFFGMAFNQLAFLQGLEFTTPISGSIIMTSMPIVTLILSWILLKYKTNLAQIIGVLLGMIGAIGLIIYGKHISTQEAKHPLLGNLLILSNAIAFSYYIIISIPMMKKYHIYTILKYGFIVGFFINLPFGFKQILEIKWHIFSVKIWFAFWYILIFVSCLTYLFNQYALKRVNPTTVSSFVFAQPFFAVITSIIFKTDSMDYIKWFFGSIICIGVYLVIKNK